MFDIGAEGRGVRFGGVLASIVFAITLIGASPAQARWLKAESERFIVYSDGSESKLRAFVQELEAYDRFLRLRMGLSVDEAPLRRLPIYLVGSPAALKRIRPDIPDQTVGFYSSTDEDIFGVAIRDMDDDILKHEYAHHFMMQNFSYPYPAWFVEGFAEYYATVEIERSRILVGQYSQNRAYWLQAASWMPMAELLSKRPLELSGRKETYYPLAWLLSHWFMGDPERQKLLDAYLRDVGAGGDSIEAMERATGLNPTQLRSTLRAYMNGRLPYQAVAISYPEVPVVITQLPRSADDLLLLNQRLKIGVPNEMRPATADAVRRAAARHPDDPLALLALGHAELHFGDPAAGEEALGRLLAIEPNNVEALQFMAVARLQSAGNADALADITRLRGEALKFLSDAYRLDDTNYATLLLIAEARAGAPGYPNDNDVTVLEQAFALAPQLGSARINLASVLLSRDRSAEAILLLEPLVNNPHHSSAAARAMLLQAKGITEAEARIEEAEIIRQGEAEGEDAQASPQTE